MVDSVYTPGGSRRAERADTRQRLVEAARAHLDERGLEGLTLREIARRAGVSHGAPGRHFPGVAHLLAAVAAQGFRELYASVEEACAELDEGAHPRERLRAAGRGYVRFAVANPGVFELMFRHERHAAQEPELLSAGADAFFQLVGIVRDAQAAGWHPDAPTGLLAGVVWAEVHGIASLWIPGTLSTAIAFTGALADLDRLLDLGLRIVIPPDVAHETDPNTPPSTEEMP